MSFSDASLLKKLQDLNSTQQSVQTLSLWLIHHRKYAKTVANTWLRELQQAAKPERKLTLMYLANDILQNSRKKGEEYLKEFTHVLEQAIENTSRFSDSNTRFTLERILNIWKDRKIYQDETIEKYRKLIHTAAKNNPSPPNGSTAPTTDFKKPNETSTSVTPNKQQPTDSSNKPSAIAEDQKKRKLSVDEQNKSGDVISEAKKPAASFREEIQRELIEKGANIQAPEPNEIITMLQELEKSASSDAVVRQRIADLPTKVTDTNEIKKLQSKQDALDLAKTINEAMSLLDSYNSRLQLELVSRRKTALQLAAFIRHQQSEIENDQKLIEEWQKKFKQVMGVKKELETHLESLPDLSSLDAVAELIPLPSAGDLFK